MSTVLDKSKSKLKVITDSFGGKILQLSHSFRSIGNKKQELLPDPQVSDDSSVSSLESEEEEDEIGIIQNEHLILLDSQNIPKRDINEQKIEVIPILELKGDLISEFISSSSVTDSVNMNMNLEVNMIDIDYIREKLPANENKIEGKNDYITIAVQNVLYEEKQEPVDINVGDSTNHKGIKVKPEIPNKDKIKMELLQIPTSSIEPRLSSEEKSIRKIKSHNNKTFDVIKMPSDPNLSAAIHKITQKEKAYDDSLENNNLGFYDGPMLTKKSGLSTPQNNQSKDGSYSINSII